MQRKDSINKSYDGNRRKWKGGGGGGGGGGETNSFVFFYLNFFFFGEMLELIGCLYTTKSNRYKLCRPTCCC